MGQGFTSWYRVDNVPWWLWLPYTLVSYSLAALGYFYRWLILATCSIEFVNRELLPSDRNYILCCWHETTWINLIAQSPFRNHVWLNHPHWYMRPIHLMVYWMGVEKLILGSSGFQGRQAADQVVNELKAGKNTIMMPDGPYGPRYQIHKGALHLSAQTGVPLIASRVTATGLLRLRDWDRKMMPIPFCSRIRIEFRPPYVVGDPNSSEEVKRLAFEMTPATPQNDT